jgi:hypothetical protein
MKKSKFKKFLVYSALMGGAFFMQACGKGSSSAVQLPATVVVTPPIGSTTYSNSGAFSEACPNGYGATTVNTPSGEVSVCRIESNYLYLDEGAQLMNLSGTGSNVVASGGLNSGIVVDAGDEINVWSVGHYSKSGQSGCSGSGVGSNGDTSSVGNTKPQLFYNSLSAGLWFAFEDESGNYEVPTAANVQCTTTSCMYSESPQQISIPGSSAGSTNTLNLTMGYNNSSLQCGDMGLYYQIIRCVDVNGLTYPCH